MLKTGTTTPRATIGESSSESYDVFADVSGESWRAERGVNLSGVLGPAAASDGREELVLGVECVTKGLSRSRARGDSRESRKGSTSALINGDGESGREASSESTAIDVSSSGPTSGSSMSSNVSPPISIPEAMSEVS
jgi:hypothetical protein